MDQERAPLAERMLAHAARGAARFHVPGHKGRAMAGEAGFAPYAGMLEMDFTELPGLDDLHAADGVIAEAQRLAAACYGADRTFFLVGGSTSGNLASVLALCERGDLAVVQRNAHKSIFHALELAGARAVFIPPQLDPESGIAGGADPQAAVEALRRWPQAKALFLTNPSYYGAAADLAPIARAAHDREVPVVVDEAHGAHFGFHPDLPPSALCQGADIAVQSTHKTGLAMTMGAMLHVRGGLVPVDRLARRLAMVQTSSPSYPILASLDLARRWMAQEARSRLGSLIADVGACTRRLAGTTPLAPVVPLAGRGGYHDPLKLVVRHRDPAVTGFALQEMLAARGVDAEMADLRHAVLALGAGTVREDLERLEAAARELPEADCTASASAAARDMPAIGRSAFRRPGLEPVDFGESAYTGESRAVPLSRAAGAVSAETVIPYPPGIPLIREGERLSEDVLRAVAELAEAGARFQGMADAAGRTILVRMQENNRDS